MTLEDQVLALQASIDKLATAVAAIPTTQVPVTVPAPTVDFTPVLAAITNEQAADATAHNALSAKIDQVLAQFTPTPAPAPVAPVTGS